MWLINVRNMALKEVVNPEEYRYAILSHRWLRDMNDEVSFQDMADLQAARRKPGFSKIQMTCRKADEKGLDYAWVDTCCIDKTSSASLQEAVNSMFRWYKVSSYCFAYLHDVETETSGSEEAEDRTPGAVNDVSESEWFTRGWTLQELIAPEVVEFYDRAWRFRGDKSLLRQKIADRTGIDVAVLEDDELLPTIPLGRRMSWASERETTRVEDRAYCLLGIFDVNMSIIYGEGANSFFRLQEEIVKKSNDLSLFAWTSQLGAQRDQRAPMHRQQEFRGILARSPAEFVNCRNIRTATEQIAPMREFAMTNNGCLRIETYLARAPNSDGVFALDCTDGTFNKENRERRLGIYLMKTKHGYVRCQTSKICSTYRQNFWAGPLEIAYIRKDLTPSESDRLRAEMPGSIIFHFHLPNSYRVQQFSALPAGRWDADGKYFNTDNDKNFTGYVQFHIRPRYWRFVIVCGLIDLSTNDPEVAGPRMHGHGSHGGTVLWATIFTDEDPVAVSQLATIDKMRKDGDEQGGVARLCGKVLTWHLDKQGRLPLKAMLEQKKLASDDDGEVTYWLAVRPDFRDGIPIFSVNVFIQDMNRLAGEAEQAEMDEEEYDSMTGYAPRQEAPDPPRAAADYAHDNPGYTYPSPGSGYAEPRPPPFRGNYRAPEAPQHFGNPFGGPSYPRPPPPHFAGGYRAPGPNPDMGFPTAPPAFGPAFGPVFGPPPAAPYGNPFAGGNGYGNTGPWR
ncbi:heterokaryon incompatibility protein-domain-containing protein [Phialemonium atrogriseum]|uniref:Heterokaryon incompatibility protein-domain-containing protein n=1 Tax=Phialemonium atrogriseum TaxID=1093897 RepID=A0AAJ0BXX7_9PEZI|nr:heterokaryon incompatibility protein-domain-containing protein [Phialemonium atrogriseum]KAK1766345.1 heterokaryon incompatibility protein-domain-containing protein [Phialemonium atrogriseum]